MMAGNPSCKNAHVWAVIQFWALGLTTGAVLNPERVSPDDVEPLMVTQADDGHSFDFTVLVAAFESGTLANRVCRSGRSGGCFFWSAGEIQRARNGPQRRNLLQATAAAAPVR
jgi:hypothetical protein